MIVAQASPSVTYPSEITWSTRRSQMYAHNEKILVTANTPKSLICFGVSPTANMDTPLITSKLNAAEPTIVDGPSTGGMASRSCIV